MDINLEQLEPAIALGPPLEEPILHNFIEKIRIFVNYATSVV
jgi:hypothetical protein